MTTYKISKLYPGYESNNVMDYETGLSIEEAQLSLDGTEKNYRRNGGEIINREEFSLTVEEGNGENRIIYEINEEKHG